MYIDIFFLSFVVSSSSSQSLLFFLDIIIIIEEYQSIKYFVFLSKFISDSPVDRCILSKIVLIDIWHNIVMKQPQIERAREKEREKEKKKSMNLRLSLLPTDDDIVIYSFSDESRLPTQLFLFFLCHSDIACANATTLLFCLLSVYRFFLPVLSSLFEILSS